MIYIKMRGRLGNQMFQYAFARKISILTNEEIVVDWEVIDKRMKIEKGNFWGRELDEFNVVVKENTADVKVPFLQRQIWGQSNKYYRNERFQDKEKIIKGIYKQMALFGLYLYQDGFLDYEYFGARDKYLYGYFESPKYFESIKSIIVDEFTPKNPLLKKNEELYRIIINTESICVTVRRGDFLEKQNINSCGVCSIDFYENGVKKIQEQYPDAVVILFSDDIQWAKENLHFNADVYCETGDDPVWEKLRLMYSCKHFVISNSTFSWWAQYLSRNEKKIVVAPYPWRVDGRKCDITEKDWVCIER